MTTPFQYLQIKYGKIKITMLKYVNKGIKYALPI